jgi:hypothetical protein
VAARPQAVDAGIAAAIGLGCTSEVWLSAGSTHMTGPRAAVYVSYVIAVVALVFRRWFPLASALVVAVSLGGEGLLFGSPGVLGVFIFPRRRGLAGRQRRAVPLPRRPGGAAAPHAHSLG